MAFSLSFEKLVQVVGNALFFLLLLVMMLDPGNAILGLKNITFVLFVGFNLVFYKPDFKWLILILPVFVGIFVSFLFSTIQQNTIDYTYFVAAIKGFSPIVLLLWIRHYDVLKLSLVPCVITCIIILVLYSIVVSYPEFEALLFVYSKEHNEMVMLTSRNWLGFKIFGMYYRSVVSFMPVLFYFLYQVIHVSSSVRISHIFTMILVFATFLISGTRAMFLTPFAILGIAVYFKYHSNNKLRYFLYPLFVLFVCFFGMVVFMMATQEGDLSNDIKYNHLISYADLFNQHIEYLFVGQGPGSVFYSKGFGEITAETEWTYLELLRCYGLLSIVILLVYLYPLYCCLKVRKDYFMLGMAFTYIIFLLVGGTNPFLLNSQGMTMLWIMYSYIQKNDALVFPNLTCLNVRN